MRTYLLFSMIFCILLSFTVVADLDRDNYYRYTDRIQQNGRYYRVQQDSQLHGNYVKDYRNVKTIPSRLIKVEYTGSDYGSRPSYYDNDGNKRTYRSHAYYVRDNYGTREVIQDSDAWKKTGYGNFRKTYSTHNYITEDYGLSGKNKAGSRVTYTYSADGYGKSKPESTIRSTKYTKDAYGSSWENQAGIKYNYYSKEGYGSGYSSSGIRSSYYVKSGYGSGYSRSDLSYMPHVKVGYTTYGDPEDRYNMLMYHSQGYSEPNIWVRYPFDDEYHNVLVG